MVRNVVIRRLGAADVPVIAHAFRSIGWSTTVEQYERYVREDEHGVRACFVAEVGGAFAGATSPMAEG